LPHWAETVARRYLEARGYVLLAENYAVRLGELDLVMCDGEVIVFVEVKQRKNTHFGTPAEMIGRKKCERLWRTAQHFAIDRYGRLDLDMRFDAVLITGSERRHRLSHLKSIFMGEG
jgi:putative endonuclease